MGGKWWHQTPAVPAFRPGRWLWLTPNNKDASAAFERLEKGSRSPQDEKIIKDFLADKQLGPETRGAPAALAGLMNPPPGKRGILPSWSAEDLNHLFNIVSSDENAKNALQRLFKGSRSLTDERILREAIEKDEKSDPQIKSYASSALEGLMIPPARGKNPSINPTWNQRDMNRLFQIVSTDQHAKEAFDRLMTGGRDSQDEKLIRDFIDGYPKTPEQVYIFAGAHAALEGILHLPPGQGVEPPSWDSRDMDDLYSAASKYNASREALERLIKGSQSREDERLVKLALKNEPSSTKIGNAFAALQGIMTPPPNE